MSRDRILLGLVVSALLGWGAPGANAQGSVVVGSEFPVKGEPVHVHVTDEAGNPVGGASIVATYRPGSSVQQADSLGVSAADGAIHWTPVEAGIATITATWAGPGGSEQTSTTSVSVRFNSPPVGGLIIMVVAGLLLVVGSVIRVYNLLRVPQAP